MLKIREKFGRGVYKLNYIGRAAAFFIMLITTFDVILRKVSSYSILGSYELTEFAMVIMVFWGIASYQVKNGHIRVDFVVSRLPAEVMRVVEAVALVIETAMACLLTYASFLATAQIFSRGTSSGILHIPQWPFYLIMSLGVVLFTILLGMDTIIKITDIAVKADRKDG